MAERLIEDQERGASIALTLSVPADPSAVRIVRSVLRGWGVLMGLSIEEIDELCRNSGRVFFRLLTRDPAPDRIVVRTPSGPTGVHLLAVRNAEV